MNGIWGFNENPYEPVPETTENNRNSLSIVLFVKKYIILDFPRYSENVSGNIKMVLEFQVIQRIVLFILLAVFSGAGCSTLMKPEDVNSLKGLEKDRYQMKTDVLNNGMVVLKNGMIIRISVQSSSTWVKVYARKAEDDLLKAERFLLLYMLDEDFKDNTFDRAAFDKKFYELVKVVTGDAPKEKTAAPKDARQKPKAPVKK
jgi:type II secretion system-associated lipoprotein